MKKEKISTIIIAVIMLSIIAAVAFITYNAFEPNTNHGIVINKRQNAEATDINSKADQLAEKMLLALSSSNYSAYISQFSKELKDQLPEKGFKGLSGLIINTSGRYLSKVFLSNKTSKEYDIFMYNATFEKEILTFELHLSNQANSVEAVKISSDNLKKLQNP